MSKRSTCLARGIAETMLLLIVCAPLIAQAQAPETKRRPNILFIFTDQQHAGMMSCAGNKYLRTPAMDSLARSGARFELAYAANPVCVPSRFSMMTGVMPSRIGMEANEDSKRAAVSPALLQNALGRIFRDSGYETVYGGKVHLPMRLEDVAFAGRSTDQRERLAEDCAAYLRMRHDKPFLLVASFINPHDICYMAIQAHAQAKGAPTSGIRWGAGARPPHELALQEALELPPGVTREEFFRSLCPPLPDNVEPPAGEPEAVKSVDPREFRFYVRDHWSDEDWRMHRWAYCRLTERVDAEIGKVLQALRDTGLAENTVVVLSSDHGDMDAAHRLEHKSVLYEEAVRVPLIISYPGRTKPGLVDNMHLVSTGLDLIPTLCDFAAIPSPPALAGRSVRPLSEGRAIRGWRDALVVESNHSRMIRTVRWKYTVYDAGSPREVLIDLKRDPGEMTNLATAAANRETIRKHRAILQKWYRDNGERLDAKYAVRD